MDASTIPPEPLDGTEPTDSIHVLRWLIFHAVLLGVSAGALAVLLPQQDWSWPAWRDGFWRQLGQTDLAVKLIFFFAYLSIAMTFCPLNVNLVVAVMAVQESAIGSNLWETALILAAVGGVASTVANLTDYHLFTLLLRHRRIGRIRRTRLHAVTARWFARSPALLLVIANIAPIPVDVIRPLAVLGRYPRSRFAVANFLGRFIRYFILAALIYRYGQGHKWMIFGVLLAAAVVPAGVKLIHWAMRSLRPRDPLQESST